MNERPSPGDYFNNPESDPHLREIEDLDDAASKAPQGLDYREAQEAAKEAIVREAFAVADSSGREDFYTAMTSLCRAVLAAKDVGVRA